METSNTLEPGLGTPGLPGQGSGWKQAAWVGQELILLVARLRPIKVTRQQVGKT
jgi:hypothetical protein